MGLDTFPETDYLEVQDKDFAFADGYVKTIRQPYYPNVTAGWDATPYCSHEIEFSNPGYPRMAIMKNNTPENF
ncbi:MAG: hypothetical protein NTV01_05130 [Bacteroidia bacterium]|nr:hypothetical protein [Bacteroidia bacterium]